MSVSSLSLLNSEAQRVLNAKSKIRKRKQKQIDMAKIKYDTLLKLISTNGSTPAHYDAIVEAVIAKDLPVVVLITKLGDVLVQSDDSIRTRGIESLSTILGKLPPEFLSKAEVKHFTSFYASRLASVDVNSLPIFDGLLALVKMKNFINGFVQDIYTAFTSYLNSSMFVKDERKKLYQILFLLITNYSKGLKTLGTDFIHMFITIFDSENNPHNLLFLFTNLPLLLTTFRLDHLSNNFFDTLTKFFPVDYNPAHDTGVTRDQLALELQHCLTSSNEFSDYVFKFAFDRLASAERIERIDSLRLLKESLEKLSKSITGDLLRSLKYSLCSELDLDRADREEKDLLYTVFKTIFGVLTRTGARRYILLNNFLNDVVDGVFENPSIKNSKKYFEIVNYLLNMSRVNTYATQFLSKKILVKVLNYARNSSDEHIAQLKTLTIVYETMNKMGLKYHLSSGFREVWRLSLNMLIDGLRSEDQHDIQITALIGFRTLNGLDEDNQKLFYLVMWDFYHSGHRELKEEALISMKVAIEKEPKKFEDFFLRTLIKYNKEYVKLEPIENCVKLVCDLCCFNMFLPVLQEVVNKFMTSTNGIYTKCVIKCLREFLEKYVTGESKYIMKSLHYGGYDLMEFLVSFWITMSEYELKRNPVIIIFDVECHQNYGICLGSMIAGISLGAQSYVVKKYIPKLFDSLRITNYAAICLIEGILGGVDAKVQDECPEIKKNYSRLIDLAICKSHWKYSLSAARLLAAILNKSNDEGLIDGIMGGVKKEFSDLNNPNWSFARKCRVDLFSLCVKTLAMRGFNTESLVDSMFHYMDDPDLQPFIVNGFQTIARNEPLFLSSVNRLEIRPLYKQRLLSNILKSAHKRITCSEPSMLSTAAEIKLFCCLAVKVSLLNVPSEILLILMKTHLSTFLNVLSQPKMLNDVIMNLSEEALRNQEPLFKHFRATFIPRFLGLVRSSPFLEIRLTAANCIGLYTQYETSLIIPFKMQVLFELGECLDDQKRLVRESVRKARNLWTVVGL